MSDYKLVPVEPTLEMVQHADGLWTREDIYRAMLDAAPSPEWIRSSERLPYADDADEGGYLWISDAKISWEGHYHNAMHYPYWMPKPRQEPPQPPEGE